MLHSDSALQIAALCPELSQGEGREERADVSLLAELGTALSAGASAAQTSMDFVFCRALQNYNLKPIH